MSLSDEEDFITRRKNLAAEISRQRGELVEAYRNLEKPIRYTEYGMKGFGFIRQNQWILTVAPALLGSLPSIFNLASSAFGWRKKKKVVPVQAEARRIEATSASATKKLSKVSQAIMAGAEQGIRAYNIYRRVRSLIP